MVFNFKVMDVEEVIDITPRNEEICRICLSGEEKGAFDNNSLYGRSLITSCNCRGNTGRYHRSCVQIWLSNQSKEADSCEICGAKFKFMKYEINCKFGLVILLGIFMVLILPIILTFGFIMNFEHCSMNSQCKESPNCSNNMCSNSISMGILIYVVALCSYYKIYYNVVLPKYYLYKKYATRIITNDDGTASLYGDELKNPFLLAKLGNKNKKLMAKKTGYKVESEKVESQNIIIMNESQVTVDIDSSTVEGTGECIL